MSIKTILAPVCGLERDRSTLATAFLLAESFAAHVEVAFARLSPSETVPLVGEGMSGTIVEQLMHSAETEWEARAEHARRGFEAAIGASGMPVHDTPPGPGTASASWREEAGREEEMVARLSHLSDLVVLGRPGSTDEDLQFTLSLEAALLAGGRPVMLAPVGMPESIGRRVAIAWRGTSDCARAVAGAMSILQRAEAVTVLTAATARTQAARASELVSYLAWHVVPATAKAIEVGGDGVGASLLDAAREDGADVIVMGGYGHSRVREMILGGVTRHIIGHAEIPVIMAH